MIIERMMDSVGRFWTICFLLVPTVVLGVLVGAMLGLWAKSLLSFF